MMKRMSGNMQKPKRHQRERGGTFLGLIIGAVIGLGAALAVAVYITKVPVPFMNKGVSRNADSDAAETQKNRDWNPNGGLAGKAVVKQPPVVAAPPDLLPSVTTPGPVVVTPAEPAVAVIVPKRPAAATVKPPVSSDPLGDLAKSRGDAAGAAPTPAPATTAAGTDPFSYFIQAGAFRTPEDAEQQRARLSLLGMQARVSEREQAGRTVYRVRLGPFDKKDDADRAKDRLDNNSVETALVRVQR